MIVRLYLVRTPWKYREAKSILRNPEFLKLLAIIVTRSLTYTFTAHYIFFNMNANDSKFQTKAVFEYEIQKNITS